jgi:hypothetical protein
MESDGEALRSDSDEEQTQTLQKEPTLQEAPTLPSTTS